jgi:hypothetical protein
MSKMTEIDSLGSRIVSAARMAVAIHLDFARREYQNAQFSLMPTAMIGGTDRRVTDDIEEEEENDEV